MTRREELLRRQKPAKPGTQALRTSSAAAAPAAAAPDPRRCDTQSLQRDFDCLHLAAEAESHKSDLLAAGAPFRATARSSNKTVEASYVDQARVPQSRTIPLGCTGASGAFPASLGRTDANGAPARAGATLTFHQVMTSLMEKRMMTTSDAPPTPPTRRPSPSPARRPSPSPSTAQRRASPSPSTTPVVDSPCRMQYKMRQDSNGWRQLGERYKKVHPSRPSDEHGGLLEGWGIPYIMPSKKHDESPTSSEFFSRHMQALGTQLQSAMGLEGEGAADTGNSLAQGSSETIARCVLCGDKTGGRSGCVLCGDHAGDTKTPQAMPWRGRACKAPGRHASTVEAFEATKPGRPVLAKYLKC